MDAQTGLGNLNPPGVEPAPVGDSDTGSSTLGSSMDAPRKLMLLVPLLRVFVEPLRCIRDSGQPVDW